MNKNIISIGICLLFILLIAHPMTLGDNVKINKVEHVNDKSSNDDIDWWPMFNHDLRRSGYSTSGSPDTNHLLWNYRIGGYVYNSPVVVNDRIYVQFAINSPEDDIYCLNATSGVKIWTSNAGACSDSSFAVCE